MAEAVAHAPSQMMASWGTGLLSLRQGNLPRALPLLERAVSFCQEADLPSYFPWMAAALGAAYTLAGRVADAVSLLTQAMEQAVASEAGRYQALCHLSLGEAHWWTAAWRRHTPSPSRRWRSPASATNGVTKPLLYASSATLWRAQAVGG